MRPRGAVSQRVYSTLPRLQLETDAGLNLAMTDTPTTAARVVLPTITARVVLRVSGRPLPLEMTVPTAAVDPSDLLPVLWDVEDRIVERAKSDAEGAGERVSCRAGCGACCRQLVPVGSAEARRLARLVRELPPARRDAVRRRVADAVARATAAGMDERIGAMGGPPAADRGALGRDWFALGLPCPFLEDESCSIHAERPLACREYLVTSPASACASPTAATVATVPLPGRLSRAAAGLDDPSRPAMIPLLFALDQDRAGEPPAAPAPAPQLLRQVIERLASSA